MILVCGESLIDLVPVTVDGETAYLPRTGGSPYNVAIGLGRLGAPVGFFGRVSLDPFGRILRNGLAAAGVDLSRLRTGPQASTLAIVHLVPGDEPRFVFYGDGAADVTLSNDDLPPDANLDDGDAGRVDALHFGSISLVREPGASAFESLMRRVSGRRLLSLDPNVRPGMIPDRLAYRARLEGWVDLADLVKVSRADLAWLYPDAAPEAAARAWLERGPSLVVMTRGNEGAVGLTADGRVEMPGIPTEVSDTVGAGDAFTAGLLAALESIGRLRRDALPGVTAGEVRGCLAVANRTASLTCARLGAQPPTRAELLADGAVAWPASG